MVAGWKLAAARYIVCIYIEGAAIYTEKEGREGRPKKLACFSTLIYHPVDKSAC